MLPVEPGFCLESKTHYFKNDHHFKSATIIICTLHYVSFAIRKLDLHREWDCLYVGFAFRMETIFWATEHENVLSSFPLD